MRNSPLVSLVTVTLNSQKTLQRTIDSVASQDYENLEYIIVDGCSSDSTIEIIKSNLHSIDLWVSEPDKGMYDAMNKGIEKCSGSIIGIINSDDELRPGVLRRIVEEFGKSDQVDIVHGKILTISPEGEEREVRGMRRIPFYYLVSTPFKHPAMFVSSELYKKLGLYDLRMGLAADYHFMLRAIRRGSHAVYIDEIMTLVHLVGISTGRKQNATLAEIYRVVEDGLGSRTLAFCSVFVRWFHLVFRRSKSFITRVFSNRVRYEN